MDGSERFDREFETLIFKKENGLARIIFNQPKYHNSINLKMTDEFAEASKLCEDSSVKVIMISGEGLSFCAGANVKEFLDNLDNLRNKDFFEKHGRILNFDVIKKMRDLPKPVITLPKGFTFGAVSASFWHPIMQ